MKKYAIIILMLFCSVCSAVDLKQSTATTVIVGPLMDSVDGKTPVTALTVGDVTAAVYKASSRTALTLTASGGSNDIAHANDGYWTLELTATDTATAGQLKVTLRDDDVFLGDYWDFDVLPANIYDSKYSTDKLQVDMAQINGDATNGNNATLSLKSLNINNPVGYGVSVTGSLVGIRSEATGAYGAGVAAIGTGVYSHGLYTNGTLNDISADELAAVNVGSISGDATAADNLEAMYDGTGYAGGSIKLQTDMVKVDGDDYEYSTITYSALAAGDTAVEVASATGFAAGKLIEFSKPWVTHIAVLTHIDSYGIQWGFYPAIPFSLSSGATVRVYSEMSPTAARVGDFATDAKADLNAECDTAIADANLAGAADLTPILADTNELQTDWTDGGRLDLILDAINGKTDRVNVYDRR